MDKIDSPFKIGEMIANYRVIILTERNTKKWRRKDHTDSDGATQFE